MASLSTIKNWFKTGLRPTEQQFSDTWNSFFHKNDNVPIAQVEGIDAVFEVINTVSANVRFVGVGQLTIYKHPLNNLPANATSLEINDVGVGFFNDNTFMPFGMYLGGDPTIVDSWNTGAMFTP
jgi:hypothetical protein